MLAALGAASQSILKSCPAALRAWGHCRVLLALPWRNPGSVFSDITVGFLKGELEDGKGAPLQGAHPTGFPGRLMGDVLCDLSAEGKFSTCPECPHAVSAAAHDVEINTATTNSASLEGRAQVCGKYRKVCACSGMAIGLLVHPQSWLESSQGSGINPANPRAWKPRQLRTWGAFSCSLRTSSPGTRR